jgi:anti-sigma B factor antagonist
MAMTVRSHGDVRILVLTGEFTLEAGGLARPLDLRGRRLDDLGEALRKVITQGTRAVLLDMAGVTFLDSAALGELVAWQKRARQAGSEIALVQPVGRVRAIIELVHLDKVFRIFEDEPAALAALGG